MTRHASTAEGAHARHRAGRDRRGRPVLFTALLVVLALVIGGGATYLYMRDSSAEAGDGGCAGPSIQVAAAPEIATTIARAVRDGGCDQIDVRAEPSALVSQRVAAGKDAPDVWIPDSSLWVERAAASAPATPQVLVASVATSPVVLASADARPPKTWVDALGDPGLVLGDPLTSTAASTPLFAGVAEAGAEQTAPLVVPLAQARADANGEAPDDTARLKQLERSGEGVTSASEQLVLATAPDLATAVPASGTLVLDYPAVLTTTPDRRADIEETTTRLTELLGAATSQGALREAGFRDADGTPLESGVGTVTPLKPRPRLITQALQQWATLALPTRSLAVIDVSGSMDFDAGGQTRMQLTTAATREGLGLFPDAAAIGLWAFSEHLDGAVDHRELLPIRRLGAKARGGTQREALAASLESLPGLTGGGTGLYDTTLAAYRTVLEGYDPHAANSVLLFTDGANEDPGSISLPQLLDRLHSLADPNRPVRIIAIGISADADESALRKIAHATGGQAYVAEDPADMPTVFREALSARPN